MIAWILFAGLMGFLFGMIAGAYVFIKAVLREKDAGTLDYYLRRFGSLR